jgi:hypothetical protein
LTSVCISSKMQRKLSDASLEALWLHMGGGGLLLSL